MILLDPVPGPFERKNSIDLNENVSGKRVVFYSLGIFSQLLGVGCFTPQQINNADVIILTQHGHSCGLDKEYRSIDGEKKTFTYNETQYTYGQLSNLNNGVYVCDTNFNLTELKNYTIQYHWWEKLLGKNKDLKNQSDDEKIERLISDAQHFWNADKRVPFGISRQQVIRNAITKMR